MARGGCLLLLVPLLVGAGLFVSTCRLTWLPWVYDYLNVSAEPRQADYIVLLGGASFVRIDLAVALYEQGFAPQIIVSGGIQGIDYVLDRLDEAGIPQEILVLPNNSATGTWQEAEQILALLRARQAHSALILTEEYGTLRVRATFAAQNRRSPLELTVVGARYTRPPAEWWQQEYNQHVIETELLKLIYYIVRYGLHFHLVYP